jgi:ABC-2 type transport system permease protein
VREVWAATVLYGLALALVEMLLGYTVPSFTTASNQQWMSIKFVQSILKGVLGTDVGVDVGPDMLNVIPWIHPIVLALFFAHALTLITRMPAGEVDRGTIDVLLGLPVSRLQVYLHETVIWFAAGLFVIAIGLLGKLVGDHLADAESPTSPRQLMLILVNGYCLYFAIGGFTWFLSALSDRRGRAVGLAFGAILASYLLSFLAQFGGFAKQIGFLSVMHYYRPAIILREPSWPIADMFVLLVIGITFWGAGALVFMRRDIRTT